jgi:hypothetical protein
MKVKARRVRSVSDYGSVWMATKVRHAAPHLRHTFAPCPQLWHAANLSCSTGSFCMPNPAAVVVAIFCATFWHVAKSSDLARFQGVFLPLDTKCPESELNQMILSSTPDGRTRTIHILHPGSNNECKLTILSPFHTTQSLRNSYYNTRGSECDKLTAEIK